MNKSCPCLNHPQSCAKKALFCKMHPYSALSKIQKLSRPCFYLCLVLLPKKAFQNKQHILCNSYYSTVSVVCQHIMWYIFAPTLDFMHVLWYYNCNNITKRSFINVPLQHCFQKSS